LIWFFKKIKSIFILEIFSFIALFTLFLQQVSLKHVILNFYSSFHSFSSAAKFIIYAFNSTELTVKAIFIALTILFVLTIRNLVKIIFYPAFN